MVVLPLPGRTRHQNQTVGTRDQKPQPRHDVLGHADRFQPRDAAALVEQTHHHRFAVLHRHRRQPYVDVAAFHARFETAVLRQSFLGNVETGDQLQARHQSGRDARFLNRRFLKNSVYALADAQHQFVGFDVHVGRAHLNRVFHDRLQQPCNRTRRAFFRRSDRRKRKLVVRQFAFEFAGDVDDVACAAVREVEHRQQFAFAHNRERNRLLQLPCEFVVREYVHRVGHAEQQLAVALLQHDRPVAPRVCLRQPSDQRRLEVDVLEVDERNAELFGQEAEEPVFVDEALVD